MFVSLLGGLGLFLLGMVLMTDGLKAAAGNRLRETLAHLTGGCARAVAAGVATTALVQSSSATVLTTIGFVSAGLLTFPQAVGVILGANLGTTTTGWLVSIVGLKLNLGAVALPIVGVGAFLRLLGRGRAAAIGSALAGFGLVFYAITLLQAGMSDLASVVDPAALPGTTLAGRLGLAAAGIAMTVVVEALDRHGLTENTLVIFLSDNGSHFEVTGEGHRPNGQLRGTKATIYEAGVRVPLIARWPDHIGVGTVSDELVASADLIATMSSLTRIPLPKNAGEDSFNILPILLGKPGAKTTREFVIAKSVTAHLAIREGHWKFIAAPNFPWAKPMPSGLEETMLFDLESDLGETNNLAAERPDVAEAMRQKLLRAVNSPGTVRSLLKE